MNYKDEESLVLFSGGQDSTTCLYCAKRKFKNVHALCIFYGQKHFLEIETARNIAKEEAGVSFQLIYAAIISSLALNSLTN